MGMELKNRNKITTIIIIIIVIYGQTARAIGL